MPALGRFATSSWRPSLLVVSLLFLGACVTALKPPGVQVDRLRVDRVRVTGLGLEVDLRLRNPNPEPLEIQRFEYEVSIGGNTLGRGYEPAPIRIEPFGEERVTTAFDVNFLRVPGAVKSILDSNHAYVKVAGTFYVTGRGGLRKLRLASEADVPVGRR